MLFGLLPEYWLQMASLPLEPALSCRKRASSPPAKEEQPPLLPLAWRAAEAEDVALLQLERTLPSEVLKIQILIA
ncbi:MAG: hypothetical protein LUO89_11985 [Methanothrix sp.]|nr:hypothetical protein [Methanothrix sp.]